MSPHTTDLTDASTRRFTEVTVDGANYKIHYNDTQRSDEGIESPAVIMLHGSGPGASGWANFHRNVVPFVQAGFRVLLLDFPGWSKSDPVVCTGSRSHFNAAVLAGFMDAVALPKAHLVGNSMGAHSAVAFALDHPHRVGKLVLMGGGTGGLSPFVPMPTEGIKLIGALYRDPTIDNLKRMMNVFVYDASSLTDALFQARLDNMLANRVHLENFVRSTAANPKQFPDVGHRLGEVAAPTLIVWGRDDRFVPMDVGLRLVTGLQRADLHVFSRCGHWAQWEHADTFNRMVTHFLA
jgi:2-hydroxy-6-oxonona-2,4-dienedioate hydrolase